MAKPKTGDNMPDLSKKGSTESPDELDQGPKRGDKGEYLPARYETPKGNVRRDS